MDLPAMNLPNFIESEDQLDELLTTPSTALVEVVRTLADPLIILGAGGKMGPSLALLARRAAQQVQSHIRIIAVSRFSDPNSRLELEKGGVETHSADVLNRDQLQTLPDSANVVYLVGMKFGTSNDPVPTWATNTIAPVHVCERFAGSKIVALSTGNVYPLVPIEAEGSRESDPLTPLGEYPNAAVARERIFQYYASRHATPTVLMRLNYAHDLRYGVLTELAGKIWRGEPIDLTMGYFNAIWQGDANEIILRSFAHCQVPAELINLTSPERYSVRTVAEQLGKLMDRQPQLVGSEAPTALLSNTERMQEKFGMPQVGLEQMLEWIAHWTVNDGPTLNKPTHFATRDGKY